VKSEPSFKYQVAHLLITEPSCASHHAPLWNGCW
jgi:hypothetical protein